MINGKTYLEMAINSLNTPWWKKLIIKQYGFYGGTVYCGNDFIFDVYTFQGEEYMFNAMVLS